MTKSIGSFGKKLRECREAKNLSQNDVAKFLNTNHSIIGKYERDEVKPTVDVVKKLTEVLGTTVGYLFGETQDINMFKDPDMLKRLNDINDLDDEDKKCLLKNVDAYLRDFKARKAYAS